MTLQIKLTEIAKRLQVEHNCSFIPKRATDGSNGYDLFACVEQATTIRFNEVIKVPTGVHIWLGGSLQGQTRGSMAYAGLYLPRSSTNNLVLTNTVGLLDSDYQGESFLKYRNMGEAPITIRTGDRIGQLLILPSFVIPLSIVEDFEEETSRGEGGFGSTGV